jgi:hypothetical protein
MIVASFNAVAQNYSAAKIVFFQAQTNAYPPLFVER